MLTFIFDQPDAVLYASPAVKKFPDYRMPIFCFYGALNGLTQFTEEPLTSVEFSKSRKATEIVKKLDENDIFLEALKKLDFATMRLELAKLQVEYEIPVIENYNNLDPCYRGRVKWSSRDGRLIPSDETLFIINFHNFLKFIKEQYTIREDTTWQPDSDIESLQNVLRSKGPLIVGFQQVVGKTIAGYKTNTEVEAPGNSHAIVIVGATKATFQNTQEDLIHFIDLIRDHDKASYPLYAMPYKNLCDYTHDNQGISFDKTKPQRSAFVYYHPQLTKTYQEKLKLRQETETKTYSMKLFGTKYIFALSKNVKTWKVTIAKLKHDLDNANHKTPILSDSNAHRTRSYFNFFNKVVDYKNDSNANEWRLTYKMNR